MSEESIQQLTNRFPHAGRVAWIGVSTERRAGITARESVQVRVGTGIDGDHHALRGNPDSKRQVTLIQAEHLPVIAALARLDSMTPEMLRRNISVAGINLLALKDCTFRIGRAVLKGSGPCAPCSRMEENLGPGGYNAMRGHGGITARVLQEGEIRVGDSVVALPDDDALEI